MKLKYTFTILIICLFIYTSPLFSQTAKILSGNIEYSQYSYQMKEQDINYNVEVKSNGTTVLAGLWLNVYLESEEINFNNIVTRKLNLPKLNPNQLYKTGYKVLYGVKYLNPGVYSVVVELRDSKKVYDYTQLGSFFIH